MVRVTVVIGALGLALAGLAVEGDAQVPELGERVRVGQSAPGWVGISFRNSPPPGEDVVVEDVVDNAPAERAGVLIGDRIVLWNGRTDVGQAIRGTRLEPGDTVRIRVRRPGARDRDMVMVAVQRPLATGLRSEDEIRQTIEELSTRLRRQSDSLRVRSEEVRAASAEIAARLRSQMDTIRLRTDSLYRQFAPGTFRWPDGRMAPGFSPTEIEVDAYYRAFGDARARAQPQIAVRRYQALVDSAFAGGNLSRLSFGPSGALADGLQAFGPGFGVMVMGGRSAVAGAELTDLGSGLSSYFGTEAGALVLRVLPGTPAEQAGLQDGDVIVAAGGRDVASISDLRRALSDSNSRTVQLEVVRHRARRTISIGAGN